MALTATIFKCELDLSDLDRNHYASYNLTLARHPSENDQRMMVRLLAFILFADDRLGFGKGISTDDEPDLWLRNDVNEIDLWIDLGQPQEKRIRQACGKSRQVALLTYQDKAAREWWKQSADACLRFPNLQVIHIPENLSQGLTALVARSMRLQCTIQDGTIWLTDDETTVEITPEFRQQAVKIQ